MNNTTSGSTFSRAWNNHIDELSSLGMPLIQQGEKDGQDYYKKLTQLQNELKHLVELARINDFS